MMNFFNLLNNYDQSKIILFQEIIDNLPERKLQLKSFKESKGLSSYRLNSLLENLNDDIYQVTGNNGFQIESHQLICDENLDRKVFNKLKDYYFKFSLQRELAIGFLKTGEFPDHKKMEIDFNWNRTSFYQQKNKLLQFANEFLQNRQLNETLIRYLLFNVFDFFDDPIRPDFSYPVSLKISLTHLNPSQRRKLKLIYKIIYFRTSKQFYVVPKNLLITQVDNKTSQIIQTLPIQKQYLKSENIFLNQFLYHIGIKKVELLQPKYLETKHQKYFLQIKKIILRHFLNLTGQQKQVSDQVLLYFSSTLAIYLALEKYKNIVNEQISNKNFDYLYNLHPRLSQTVAEIIKEIDKNVTQVYGYERLHFDLMAAAFLGPFKIFQTDIVHICLDFAGGYYTNSFIERLFKKFLNFEIQVDDYIGPETDLYVTDQYNKKHDEIPQIVWLRTPTLYDWLHLTRKIEEVKRNRLQKA